MKTTPSKMKIQHSLEKFFLFSMAAVLIPQQLSGGEPAETAPPPEAAARMEKAKAEEEAKAGEEAEQAADEAEKLKAALESIELVAISGGRLGNADDLGGPNVGNFQIGKTEVTWGQWTSVRDWAVRNGYDLDDVGQGNGERHPVTHLAWTDALKWCNAASEAAGLTPVYTVNGQVYRTGQSVPDWNENANGYRLPSEAEWVFASLGGNHSQGYTYSGSNNLAEVGWYENNSNGSTQPVGQKKANELGLHDMSGNVYEWCWDASDSFRRIRGGSWRARAGHCSISARARSNPAARWSTYGFRLALCDP